MNQARLKTGVSNIDSLCRGLPYGGITLLQGAPRSGKSRFALEFILRGAVEDEPGVFLSFRQPEDRVHQIAGELGFDLARTIARGLVRVECALAPRATVLRSGEFTLDGLLVRLNALVTAIRARRLVIDELDLLLSRYYDRHVVVQEPPRLAEWARRTGLTTMITECGEQPNLLSELGADQILTIDETGRLREVR